MPLIRSGQILSHPMLHILHVRERVLWRLPTRGQRGEADAKANVFNIRFGHDVVGGLGEHGRVDEQP